MDFTKKGGAALLAEFGLDKLKVNKDNSKVLFVLVKAAKAKLAADLDNDEDPFIDKTETSRLVNALMHYESINWPR